MRKHLVAALACIACAVVAAPAQGAFPGDNGKIAFVQPGDGLYTVNPDGTDVTPVRSGAGQPAWSPGGSRLAYVDGASIYTSNPDGTGEALVLDTGAPAVMGISWSPDAAAIAFAACISGECDIYTVNADGTGLFNVTRDTDNDYSPAWSPEGSTILYAAAPQAGPSDLEIEIAYSDGSVQAALTDNTVDDTDPNWSPDGGKIVFFRSGENAPVVQDALFVMNSDGSDAHPITPTDPWPGPSANPAWSPNGDEIAFAGERQTVGGEDAGLFAVNPTTGATRFITAVSTTFGTYGDVAPDWQPLTPQGGGYPRPRSASPVNASLVPAYAQCTEGNRTHGPPLELSSCAPPQQASPNLTVGTVDANGAAARSVSYVRTRVLPGDPVTTDDEADIFTAVLLTDVRNASDYSDYTGELELEVTVRITDRENTPGSGADATATVTDFPLSFTVPCTPTPNPDVGSFCELETGLDALTEGGVKERQRAIWQLGEIQVHDGGPDGVASTEPNALFMTRGLFVP